MEGPVTDRILVLWSSKHAKEWQVLLLALTFFVVVWGCLLGLFVLKKMLWRCRTNRGPGILKRVSRVHTWAMSVFAIGLGKLG